MVTNSSNGPRTSVAVAAPPTKMKNGAKNSHPTDGTAIVELDPWLGPFKDDLRRRFHSANEWIKKLNAHEGGLDGFSKVYSISIAPPPPLSSHAHQILLL